MGYPEAFVLLRVGPVSLIGTARYEVALLTAKTMSTYFINPADKSTIATALRLQFGLAFDIERLRMKRNK